jgi:outer membrane receptor protein involved in Fe transport
LGYDKYEGPDDHVSKLNPKLGLQWIPTDKVRFRLAAFRTVKPPFVADRTIQPTQVAGFDQFFDDTNGTEAWVYGAGADFGVTHDLTLGLEFTKRTYDEPVNLSNTETARDPRREYVASAYLDWTPHPQWALRGEVDFDRFKSKPKIDSAIPESVTTWSTPLSVRYFSPMGIFADLTGTFVYQDVVNDGVRSDGNNGAFLVDAAIGYRFPERRGLIGLQALNLFDTHLKYQDDSYREFRDAFGGPQAISSARFLPNRTIIARLALNF